MPRAVRCAQPEAKSSTVTANMNCPSCDNEESKVIDSRESPDGIRRRRECLRCRQRYTTYERVHTVPLMVAKRDNRREPFSAEKLERSFRIACAKRPFEIGSISKMVSDIERELHLLGKPEIESSVIGEMAIERLKELDSVAYIRYASVYRDFQDEESFAREIESLADDSATGGRRSQLRLIPDNVPRLADRGGKRRKMPAS